MNAQLPHAVFLIGGAANGKSTALRLRYRLVTTLSAVAGGNGLLPLHADRKLDPDDFKKSIAMFTYAIDDEEAKNFERGSGLGGPSGPKTLSEYQRYPAWTKESVEATLEKSLGTDLAGFVEQWLSQENPDFPDEPNWNFGGGLTHELSKALAQRHLRRFLSERPPTGSFAWDAIGNAVRYKGWIADAHEAGYCARVIYVRAPLTVAHMWADQRKRKLTRDIIIDTYEKAAEAAAEMERYVAAFAQPDLLAFEQIARGDDLLDEAVAQGYTELGPPKA